MLRDYLTKLQVRIGFELRFEIVLKQRFTISVVSWHVACIHFNHILQHTIHVAERLLEQWKLLFIFLVTTISRQTHWTMDYSKALSFRAYCSYCTYWDITVIQSRIADALAAQASTFMELKFAYFALSHDLDIMRRYFENRDSHQIPTKRLSPFCLTGSENGAEN